MSAPVPRARWVLTILPTYRCDVDVPRGYAVARARWRRCFAFSLAFLLFALIALLDFVVFFIGGSDLDGRCTSSGHRHRGPLSQCR